MKKIIAEFFHPIVLLLQFIARAIEHMKLGLNLLSNWIDEKTFQMDLKRQKKIKVQAIVAENVARQQAAIAANALPKDWTAAKSQIVKEMAQINGQHVVDSPLTKDDPREMVTKNYSTED